MSGQGHSDADKTSQPAAVAALRRGAPVLVVALLIGLATLPAVAATGSVVAPEERGEFVLGPDESGFTVKLSGWYCTDGFDLAKKVKEKWTERMGEMNNMIASTKKREVEDLRRKLMRERSKARRWVLRNVGVSNSTDFILSRGETKTQTVRYCYTRSEIDQTVDWLEGWLIYMINKLRNRVSELEDR